MFSFSVVEKNSNLKFLGTIVENCGNGFCNYIILIIKSPLQGIAFKLTTINITLSNWYPEYVSTEKI